MTIVDILLTGAALSMDAMAASLLLGLSLSGARVRHALVVGLCFGLAQALMPLLGFLLGSTVLAWLRGAEHWIAFLLLASLGAKMALEPGNEQQPAEARLSPRFLLTLAVATSLDALAVGVGLALTDTPIALACSLIGVVTLLLCAPALLLGRVLGVSWRGKAQRLGGLALIAIGVKILLEGLFQ